MPSILLINLEYESDLRGLETKRKLGILIYYTVLYTSLLIDGKSSTLL